jgi:hypothetical protein
VRAVAVRRDADDVLFEVAGLGYAVVHLTWSGHSESSASFPWTRVFESFDDWQERGMNPDHREYSGG